MHVIGFLVVIAGAVISFCGDEATGTLAVEAGLLLMGVYALMQILRQRRERR